MQGISEKGPMALASLVDRNYGYLKQTDTTRHFTELAQLTGQTGNPHNGQKRQQPCGSR